MKRLVVVGMDGATFDLILPWVEEGRLPAFAGLLEKGASGDLASVPNMNTAPAWTTFMTGKNPGKHGIFWFAEEGDAAGTVRFVTAADRKAVSIWRLLSDQGHRVGVMNVPLTYPAEPVNGVLVAGFDAPSTASRNFSHPEDAIAELERRCGTYNVHAAIAHHALAGRRERVVEEALKAEESRVRAALSLLEQEPWDVFMYMIKATDMAAHYLWDFDDPSQDSLRQIYEYADSALARFLSVAGEDCGVVVMSDHGFGWRQPAAEYLNDILIQLGYMKRQESASQGATWKAFRIAKRLGPQAKGAVKRLLPGLHRRFGYKIRFGGIDWTGTRAYSDNTRHCVWINLRGRNPNGIVEPADYDRTVEEVREILSEIVDSDTGQRAVEAVWRPDEIYSGPYTNEAPDLQIHWRYDRPVHGLVYDGRLGRAAARQSARGMMTSLTGAHRPTGILMMSGPQFQTGVRVEGAGLQDLAPTILHLAEVPVPNDMDGRVLLEALADPYASTPVAHAEPGPDGGVEASTYSKEEAAEVEERLRSLGYL
jgi:predicted AlkP superfamily phosphohydrolase/phosphomutase